MTLYNNYCNMLSLSVDINPVQITFRPDGQVYAVICSVDITPDPLPMNVSYLNFEWFFDSSLPSGTIVSDVMKNGNSYIYKYSTVFSSDVDPCRDIHMSTWGK